MNTPKLANFYNILSTNKDRQGVEFVSSIEAKNYPIYGTQWHPEKPSYEWKEFDNGAPREDINHTAASVQVQQYMANFLVGLARKNYHQFATFDQQQVSLNYHNMSIISRCITNTR